MGLVDVTAAGVRHAVDECDELGRDAFLSKYGFGRARDYFLVVNQERYDSKAIVGAAHAHSGAGWMPLGPAEFSGGEQTVAALLESLGFNVTRPATVPPDVAPTPSSRRNPKWADPELILALDLYLREGLLDDKDPEVVELSQLLNRLPIHTDRPDAAHFRNENGVALKLANFAALDPGHEGKGMSRGGRRDAEIWELYSGDEVALREAAVRIRAGDVSPTARSEKVARPTVSTVPIEARNVDQFTVNHVARTAAAERREQQLVLHYQAHLEGQGHKAVRHKYTVDGRSLYCDLYDETSGCLYEAKGDVTRESLRMAVGQLLDYARFYEVAPALAVLLPRRPSEDMFQYLKSVSVAIVFRDADGLWTRASSTER